MHRLTFVSRWLPRMGGMGHEYQAYLLRLQRSQTARHWWATLENAHTSEVCHFATEELLMRYLWQLLGHGRIEFDVAGPSNPSLEDPS